MPAQQLVFIDESGDTGFKIGSSRFFAIAMVVFNDLDSGGRSLHAEATAACINAISQKYRIKPEYRFSKSSHQNREHFFRSMAECHFAVYALVVDKAKISSKELRESPRKFYNFFLKMLLDKNPIQYAKVKLDGERSRTLGQAIRTYLRQQCPTTVHSFDFADSRKNKLIQLADMVCGAIYYSYNKNSEFYADRWQKLLSDKIKNIWEFK